MTVRTLHIIVMVVAIGLAAYHFFYASRQARYDPERAIAALRAEPTREALLARSEKLALAVKHAENANHHRRKALAYQWLAVAFLSLWTVSLTRTSGSTERENDI